MLQQSSYAGTVRRKMQAATIIFIVDKLGDGEELRALKDLFEVLDKDNSGQIDREEMYEAGW